MIDGERDPKIFCVGLSFQKDRWNVSLCMALEGMFGIQMNHHRQKQMEQIQTIWN